MYHKMLESEPRPATLCMAIHPPCRDSFAQPKFKVCKLVTWHPLAGLRVVLVWYPETQ